MTRPTVAYVGLDHPHCPAYLDSLAALPVELACACEPDASFDPDSLDALGDVPVYRDPARMLDAEPVDAAWVTLSNRDAPPVLELLADRGVDAYAEKTMARTAADLDPVAEAFADAGATLVAGYQNRGAAPARAFRDRVAEGFFGDLHAAEARMIASRLDARDTASDVYDADASRGGILQWLGCHYLDLLQWVLDERVARVSAQVSYGTDGVDVEDGATVQFETASGTMGTLQAGYYHRRYDTYVGLHGADGRATWDPSATGADTDVATYTSYDGSDWSVAPERTVTYEYDDAPGYGGTVGLDYMGAFLDAREGDDAALAYVATVEEALAVLRVLDAAYESARSGRWVDVEHAGD